MGDVQRLECWYWRSLHFLMQNVRSQKCTVAESGNLNKNEISKNRGVWTKIGSKLERKKRLQNHLFLHTNQSANLASLSKFSNQWLLVLDSLFIFFFGFFSPKFSSHEKKKFGPFRKIKIVSSWDQKIPFSSREKSTYLTLQDWPQHQITKNIHSFIARDIPLALK